MSKMTQINSACARRRAMLLLGAGMLACPAISNATTYTWDGSTTSGSGTFGHADNWVGNVVPPTTYTTDPTDLLFGSINTHGYTPTSGGAYTLNSITFNASALAFTINGGPLTFNAGGITDSSTNAEKIGGNNSIILGTSQTWSTVAGGTLIINNDVLSNTSSSTLTETGAGFLDLNLSTSNPSSISAYVQQSGTTQLSSGTLVLTTTSGNALSVNAGLFNLSSGAVINTSAGSGIAALIDTGASALVTGSGSQLNAPTSNGNIYVGYTGAATLNVSSQGLVTCNTDFIGRSSGNSQLVINSGTLNSANTYFGSTTGSIGTGTVNGSGAVLTATTLLNLGGGTNGQGILNITSGGNVSAGTTNFSTTSASININQGMLNTGGITGGGSIALTADPTSGSALTINGASATSTFSGNISGGTGTLLKSGGSTQILSGNINTSGNAIVTGGLLSFNGSGTSSIYTLQVAGGAANVSAGTVKLTDTNPSQILSAGVLTVSNMATLDASAQNSYEEIDGTAGTGLTVTGTGSTYKGGYELLVGGVSQGVLTVQSGGSASASYLVFGAYPGSSGTLSTASGATVSCSFGVLGDMTGSNGIANVNGGSWNCSSGLYVGGGAGVGGTSNASGSVTVSFSGTVVTPFTSFQSNTASVTLNGGTFTSGYLTSYNTGDGAIYLQDDPSRGSALTINDPTATDINTYSGTITGAASFQKSGGSTQILSGYVSTHGNATVTAGTLIFNSSGGSNIGALNVSGGTVNVSGGALTLSQSGQSLTVNSGMLTINGGATLDGSAGTTDDQGASGTGVNVTSAASQFKTGSIAVGFSSPGFLNVSSGAAVIVTGGTTVGGGSGGNGTILVSGGMLTTSTLFIGGLNGMAGGNGALTVTAGGAFNASGGITFFDNTASINISGGTLTTGYLSSNAAGNGSIALKDPIDGTALTINDSATSDFSTYSGTITGTGNIVKTGGSTQIFAGNESFGTLSLQGGTTEVTSGTLTSTLTGSEPASGISVLNSAVFNVSGGAKVYASGNIDASIDTGGSALVTGSGSQINDTGHGIEVGYYGSGSLTVNSSGSVSCASIALAAFSGSVGTVSVSGAGSQISSGMVFLGGNSGSTGLLAINNSGSVINTGAIYFSYSAATLNISGGTVATGSLSSFMTGNGAINLLADPFGGTALTINDANASDVNTYSGTISGAGSFQKSGGSTQILSGNLNSSGSATVNAGTLIFNGTGNSSVGTLVVHGGAANVSAGTLKLTSGSTALQALSGTLTVSGSTLDASNSNTCDIGGPAGVTVNVTGAGTHFNAGSDLQVGPNYGDTGTLNISNSAQVSCNEIDVPFIGVGALSVTSGGVLTAKYFYFGSKASTVSVSSGSAVVVSDFTAFYDNVSPFNVTGGTLTTGSLGSASTGNGIINLTDPASGTALTINGAGGINVYSGSISGTGSIQKSGGSTQILSGTDTFTGSVQVTGGVLELASRNAFSTLVISSGATTQINGSGNILVVPTLAILPGGTLDLTKDSADLPNNSLQTLTTLAKQGYNNGKWTGTGLTSSSAAADTTYLTAVGVIQNNQSGTALYTASKPFEGVTPGVADILAKFTYYGDTNLDGKVDGSDYSRIDAAFLADKTNPAAMTGWFNGDFNYDGVINGSDYTLMDNAFNTQGAVLSDELATATAQIGWSAVPEPSALFTFAFGAVGLLGLRRNWYSRPLKTHRRSR